MIVGNNNITVTENANFTAKNSMIKSEVIGQDFNLYIYGHSNLYNITLNSSQLDIRGNKTHYINKSTFNDYVYFRERPIINLFNSNFTSRIRIYDTSTMIILSSTFYDYVYFYENSTNTIQNSQFTNIIYVYQFSILNFTQPKSNITNEIRFYNTPQLYGYVDMPPIGLVGAGATLSRYYPVHIVYTSNTTKGIPNKQVNITDYLGNLVWNGTTNASGWVIANLTFNSTNYGPGNFTISVNPSDNISLLTDTPMTFDVSDSTNPIISNINATPDPVVQGDPCR